MRTLSVVLTVCGLVERGEENPVYSRESWYVNAPLFGQQYVFIGGVKAAPFLL